MADRQPGGAGPLRRILFQPRRARESYGYQRRRDAFLSTAGRDIRGPPEATAEDKFQIEGVAVFTFDAVKNQMTVKRRSGERVFTKEK